MVNERTLEDSGAAAVTDKQKQLVLLVYILQAASFLVGITALAGLIINYLAWEEVDGTWLETHFKWQIKTFWFAVLGFVAGAVLFFIVIGGLIMLVTSIWVIYRIIKGWLAYRDQKPLPDTFF